VTILLGAAITGTVLYLTLLRYYQYWWKAPSVIPKAKHTNPFISIVIAARNESAHIDLCLRSVLGQSYPANQYEVIVVDDQSEDNTYLKIQQDERVLALQTKASGGKKDALALGIEAARGELIAITDADCLVPESWLNSIAQAFDSDVQLITGPVLYHPEDSAFTRFQALDVLSLACITAAGIESGRHHLANGANMAFRIDAYNAVSGYATGGNFASGDDLFLAQAISAVYPGSIRYLWGQQSSVSTSACKSLHSFIEQRVRWASKNSGLPEKSVFWIWTGICIVFVLNLVTLISALFHSAISAFIGLIVFILIFHAEYWLLRRVATYYQQQSNLRGYLLSAIMHYCYVVLMGLIVPFRRHFQWKGRAMR
jgi:cellulose synthase/poly-beta-1,6-N-acetylglucosamine synthase-like glycosyltransferase